MELYSLKETYEIVEKIGAGGGGEVYKAYHTRLKTYVIIKKTHNRIVNKMNTRIETDILKNLKSPYLPKVLDYFEGKEGVFTIMEYIPGKSLQKYMDENRRFTQKDILKWSRQLTEAVAYLHNQNPPIIHSDIKPDNIMLTPKGDICLIDFNISLSAEKGTAEVVGITKGYSPPEQYSPKMKMRELENEKSYGLETKAENESDIATVLKDESLIRTMFNENKDFIDDNNMKQSFDKVRIDTRADIYSIGATIYHLLSGQRPGASVGYVTPLSDYKNLKISDGMVYIVQKAMEKIPEKRFHSAKDLLNALNKIHKLDRRYKRFRLKEEIIYSFILIIFFGSIITINIGLDEIKVEKNIKYNQLIEEGVEQINQKKYDSVEKIYKRAVKLYDSRNEAYRMQMYSLYKLHKYKECIELGENYTNGKKRTLDNELAEIYFLIGNSYYELEDYETAVWNLNKAIEINDENSDYYRDYAVTLARTGDTETAREIINTATEKGIEEADLHYVNSEICFVQENYNEAIVEAELVHDNTEDDYLDMRAYVIESKSYKELGKQDVTLAEKNIKLLNSAAEVLDEEHVIVILNMLAQEYVDNERNEEAVNIFNKIIEDGWGTYSVYYSRAILYQKMDCFEQADMAYKEIIDLFGENYDIYKRLAFMEADKQMGYENSKRNYERFNEYYQKSFSIYAQIEDSNDGEMETLRILYEDVKNGGWFN